MLSGIQLVEVNVESTSSLGLMVGPFGGGGVFLKQNVDEIGRASCRERV